MDRTMRWNISKEIEAIKTPLVARAKMVEE